MDELWDTVSDVVHVATPDGAAFLCEPETDQFAERPRCDVVISRGLAVTCERCIELAESK